MNETDAMNDFVNDVVPKTSLQVVRRSFVLAAVVCRGSIEKGVNDPDALALHESIIDWLTRLNLWDEVEPSEKAMLRCPLGQLQKNDVIQATWYVEGLAILAWALKLFEFPQHDEQVDSYVVTNAVWFLSDTAENILAHAELRSLAELEACYELLYAIHSRLRDYRRNRIATDFSRWVEEEWLTSLGVNASTLIAGKDIAVDNKPVIGVAEDRLQELLSITLERHRAIIWLVENCVGYSDTTVDT
jgi:hypothetical protein